MHGFRFTFYGSVNTLQSSQHILEYITVADINWQENLIGFTQQIFCKKEKQLLTPDLQFSILYLVWANNSMAMLILNNLCSQLVVMKFGGELMAFILQTMRKYLKPTNYFTLVILCQYNYFQDSCRYSCLPWQCLYFRLRRSLFHLRHSFPLFVVAFRLSHDICVCCYADTLSFLLSPTISVSASVEA